MHFNIKKPVSTVNGERLEMCFSFTVRPLTVKPDFSCWKENGDFFSSLMTSSKMQMDVTWNPTLGCSHSMFTGLALDALVLWCCTFLSWFWPSLWCWFFWRGFSRGTCGLVDGSRGFTTSWWKSAWKSEMLSNWTLKKTGKSASKSSLISAIQTFSVVLTSCKPC